MLFLFTLFVLLHYVAAYPGGVPSCSVPYPVGHNLLESASQSYSNPDDLPVKFSVIEEDSSMRIIMEGDFIKGYLIRPGKENSSGNPILDFLHLANDFLKSFAKTFNLKSEEDNKKNSIEKRWSIPDSFPPGLVWTTIEEGCVHHNRNFSRGREPEEKTYMEFEFKSKSKNPTFEAIIVQKFDTWWHKILISKNSEGVYETKINV